MTLSGDIEAVIKSNDKSSPDFFRRGLLALSMVYAAGVHLRTTVYDKKIIRSKELPCFVISVGNITLGGTGKTPLTIYLAELMKGLGHRSVILSRGYGGSAEKKGGLVHNGKRLLMKAEECGDEAFMMAQRLETIPIFVGANRHLSGLKAMQQFAPDVILLDDAFQHRQLVRDLDLVLLDAAHPFGNAHLFPRGPLREPVASLARCHAVVFTRSNLPEPSGINPSTPFLKPKPTYYSSHTSRLIHIIPAKGNPPDIMDVRTSNGHMDFLKGKRVWAFAGIARNEDFFNSIQSNECEIEGVSSFPDHHTYSRTEIQEILKTAEHRGVDCIVTTEKDYCRLTFDIDRPLDLVVMGVDLTFQDNAFDQFIQTGLTLYKSSNRSRKE